MIGKTIARYGTLYFCEMKELHKTHPEINSQLKEQRGAFTYQSGHHRPCTSIACDQAIEQTVNRHSKSRGGIVGFTKNPAATQRWTLTQPHRTAVHEGMKQTAGLSTEMYDNYELSPNSWSADDIMRQQLREVISSRIDPFGHADDKLVSITSGKEASDEVMKDLDCAFNVGEARFKDFVNERLKKSKDFFVPIKMVKSKTFASLKRRTKKSATKLSCSKRLFDRLLVVSQQRKINIKDVLCYSLGDVSWCLATPEGSLLKTTKSTYMNAIEENLTDCYLAADELCDKNTLVLDAMAELQSLKQSGTFGDLADQLLRKICSMALSYKAERVDFVCDTYPTSSIKGIERSRRADSGSQRVTIYNGLQKIPIKFKSFFVRFQQQRVSCYISSQPLGDGCFACKTEACSWL